MCGMNWHQHPPFPHPMLIARDAPRDYLFFPLKPPSLQKFLKSPRLKNTNKIRFSLQMSVTFNLFACAVFNVLCCFRSTQRAEEPEIISPPANTMLEPLERPIMQFAPDLPTSVTTAQIPSELPSVSDLVQVRHP